MVRNRRFTCGWKPDGLLVGGNRIIVVRNRSLWMGIVSGFE